MVCDINQFVNRVISSDKEKLGKDLGELQDKVKLERQEAIIQTDELRLEIGNKDKEIEQVRGALVECQGELQRLEGNLVELDKNKKGEISDLMEKLQKQGCCPL